MVWSSARPSSVQAMCAAIFSKQQREQLVAVWARDTLGLTEAQYHGKCQTSKNLEQVWRDPHLCKIKRFSQHDTIMIDDSKLKLLAHPHNLIEVPEFSTELVEKGTDNALTEVIDYLEMLRPLPNVSAYIKHTPLRFSGEPRKIKKPKNRLDKKVKAAKTSVGVAPSNASVERPFSADSSGVDLPT